ncbi:MAG: nuclear transport factor 2 family protein [Novosphingobium sp.]|nr:nuclear transport factor 2 family protein [Novosphingobium sp.]
MVRKGLVFNVFAAAVMACALGACEGTPPPKSATASTAASDRAEIERLVVTEMEGARDHDIDKTMSVYAPGDELVLFDAAPGVFKGYDAMKAAYLKYFAMFPGRPVTEIQDLTIGVSGDLAFAHSIQKWDFQKPDGTVLKTMHRVTNVFRRIDGKWLCVHEHASVPVNLFKEEGGQ